MNKTLNVTSGSLEVGGVDYLEAVRDNLGSGVLAAGEGIDITVGSTAITLGSSSTVLAGLTQVDVDNIRILDNTVASTTGTLFLDPTPIGTDSGDVIVRGNLQVNGVQTIINSTVTSINDLNMVLADSAANAAGADGAGLTIGGAGYSGTKATFTYNGSNDE